MHSPGYSKPAHGYGVPSPAGLEGGGAGSSMSCPESSLLAWGEHLLAEEENWAGRGFETPYEEP